MFRPLSFKSMRQQHHNAGRQIPFIFASEELLGVGYSVFDEMKYL